MYVLILYITVVTNVNGVVVNQHSTKKLAEFETLRDCYNHAKQLKLNVESYSCLPKNP